MCTDYGNVLTIPYVNTSSLLKALYIIKTVHGPSHNKRKITFYGHHPWNVLWISSAQAPHRLRAISLKNGLINGDARTEGSISWCTDLYTLGQTIYTAAYFCHCVMAEIRQTGTQSFRNVKRNSQYSMSKVIH